MKKIINVLIVVVFAVGLFSCSKDALNPTLAQQKSVNITTMSYLKSLLNGAYWRMVNYHYYGRDYILYGEVRSDQCYSNGSSGRFLTPASMDMGDGDGYAYGTWLQMYRVISNANLIIKQDPAKITGASAAAINQVMGQAYALRAWVHFDLLKLYGEENAGGTLGVPYLTSSKDLTPSRGTVVQNRDSIQADLTKALSLMTTAQNGSNVYISTWAVWALKSRVDLYFGNYSATISDCEKVINSGKYSIISAGNYASTWTTPSSPNIIFQLAQSGTVNQGINGLSYMYRGADYGDVAARPGFDTIFGATDVRGAADMIGYETNSKGTFLRNIGKYPTNPSFNYDIPLIRYEEVILNYAEALYRTGKTTDALTWLNKIPANRDASLYTTVNEANILMERQKELCFEGFAFDDVCRTHGSVQIMNTGALITGTAKWGDYNFAFPIPLAEMNANPNMVQNKGY